MSLAAPVTVPAAAVPRDRWQRPMIVPPGGGKPVAYTRPSTLAKTLSDGHALSAWRCRMVAVGIAARRDLVAMAATAAEDRDRLDEVVAAALETAQASRGARLGTAIHAATESVDAGGSLAAVPEVVRGDVEAYVRATAGLEVLAVEAFVVNDELRTAGTFDRLVRLRDGRVVVADLKTGGPDAPRYGGNEWALQLACYAGGAFYDPGSGARRPLHEDLDTRTGLVVHVPEGTGTAALYRLRLDWGHEAALLANRVRAFRKARLLAPFGG